MTDAIHSDEPTDLTDPAVVKPEPEATDGGLRARGTRSRLAFAAFMAGAGISHFVVPDFYERIVPRWIGHEQAVVAWSGVAEILCGTLVAIPRTRRVGAWLSFVTILAVYPANIQMAIDTGRPKDAFSLGVWLRLPMQFPMLAWAFRVASR